MEATVDLPSSGKTHINKTNTQTIWESTLSGFNIFASLAMCAHKTYLFLVRRSRKVRSKIVHSTGTF